MMLVGALVTPTACIKSSSKECFCQVLNIGVIVDPEFTASTIGKNGNLNVVAAC